MLFPEQPTENIWQSLGQAATQGAGIYDNLRKDQIESQQRQNVLQDLVARRTAAVLEQQRQAREDAQKEWEFNKKQEDEKKADAARQEVNALLTKGVKVPGVSSVIPPKTENVPGPWAPSQLPASAPYDVPEAGMPVTPVTTPEQAVTASDSYRPATPQDIRDALYKNEQLSAKDYTDLSPFDKAKATAAGTIAGYTADNHSDFMSKAASYVQNKLAADPTKPPSMAEVDAAAALGDPQGNRFSDKAYQAYIKSFDKGAAAQNSNTAVNRLPIAQQNADANTMRAKAEAGKAAGGSDPFDSKRTSAEDRAQRIYNSHEAKYELKASAFIDAMASAKDKTGASDQGLIDNWVKVQTGSSAPTEAQYKQALGTVGLANLASSFFNHAQGAKLADDKRTEMIDNLTKVMGDVHQRHMTYKDFTKKSLAAKGLNEAAVLPDQSYEDAVGSYFQPAANPTLDKLGLGAPAAGPVSGAPKIGDTKFNSHGVKVVFGPGGWTLAQ